MIDLYWWRIKLIIQCLKDYNQKERIFEILQKEKVLRQGLKALDFYIFEFTMPHPSTLAPFVIVKSVGR
jgi:hypothetical protein